MAEVIRQVRPTMLIGTSGIAGAFTEAIVREMARHTDRPMIFPLSSPPAFAEATPADLIAWTDGRALIATGSPFTPVTHKGITHVIGQTENAMLYPGLGLGTIVSRARLVSVGMLAAAVNALSSLVAVRLPGASLLPYVDDLRSVTVTVAVAVAEAAVAEGLADSRTRGHRSTGGRRDVATGISPDPSILTMKILIKTAPHKRILQWTQWMLFAGAILMLGYCGFVLVDTFVFQKQETAALEQFVPARLAAGNITLPAIGPDGLIGRMQVERLGVSVVVIEGTSNKTLRRAVGHIAGTALPGQTRQCGNRRAPRYILPAVAKYPGRRHHHADYATRRVPLPRGLYQSCESGRCGGIGF